MRFCSICHTVNDDDLRWCSKCKSSLAREAPLKSAGAFNNDFQQRYGEKIHRKHRWLNVQVSLILSTAVNLFLFGGIARIGGLPLLVIVIVGTIGVLMIHKLRLDYLWSVSMLSAAISLTALLTGILDDLRNFIPFTIAMLPAILWYVFLGYQLKMNNEMHK